MKNIRKETRECIAFIGKLPPPIMGPSIWLSNIQRSDLSAYVDLVIVDIKYSRHISDFGSISPSKLVAYIRSLVKLITVSASGCGIFIVPVSQSYLGFFRDSSFIVLLKALGRKVVMFMHGSEFEEKLWNRKGLIPLIFRRVPHMVDAGVALSETIYHSIEHRFPEGRLKILRNFTLDENKCVYRSRGRYVRLLWVSALHPRKGVKEFVEAVNILLCKHMEIEVIVAGEWSSNQYEREVRRAGQEHPGSIEFVGEIFGKRKQEWFQWADMFVFTPAEKEGQPMVLIEAMEAGLGIISTNMGGISDMIDSGRNGILLEIPKPSEIAEAIVGLLNNRDAITQMGIEARKMYEERYTQERFVSGMMEIIEVL